MIYSMISLSHGLRMIRVKLASIAKLEATMKDEYVFMRPNIYFNKFVNSYLVALFFQQQRFQNTVNWLKDKVCPGSWRQI